jgi:hypothetical protein
MTFNSAAVRPELVAILTDLIAAPSTPIPPSV